MISWVDLSTPDPAAAQAFYGGLFGWQFDDVRHEGELIYHNAHIDGYRVAGLGRQDAEMAAGGVPALWTTYINHEDAAAVAAKAQRAGGTVLVPPMQVMDQGHMAVIVDPSGAVFGVWQPLAHIGAQLVNMPNTLVWNELQTPAIGAARDFYGEVFGWEYEVDGNGYVLARVNGREQAGMMALDPSWGDVPPNWLLYFLVSDAAAAAARAQELGGSVSVPVTEAPGVGRFAILSDPQGAVFSVIEYDAAPPPPPGY
jgi:predicted enzyme related to lactoylglutathione lyase